MEWSPPLIALMIFCLRIVDVSIGTVRVIYSIRGNRFVAAGLGIIESTVWVLAISKAIKYVDRPISIAGWAIGFGAGTLLGITIERWIASGFVLVRTISANAEQLRTALVADGFGTTVLEGKGRDGAVKICFVVTPRRRANEILQLVQNVDPDAFITIEAINTAVGGYVPGVSSPSSMRK